MESHVRQSALASATHTAITLLLLAGFAYGVKVISVRIRAQAIPNPSGLYLFVIVCEWIIFTFMLLGVRSRGVSTTAVLGPRWKSARNVFLDIGIAVAFWIVAAVCLWAFGTLLRVEKTVSDMHYIIPHGASQLVLWVCFAVTAGVCEEAIFRGYLQTQFSVFMHSAPGGIGLSAILFGACHLYQGARLATMIALYGGLYGILAYWRKSVRPGMIAHAWQDAMGGILSSILKR